MAVVADDAGRQVLRELRTARRRHYLRQLDWVDALYKAYLTAIGAGVGTLLLSGALGDARAGADTVHTIAARGPAVLGLIVALLLAGGLRTGARGGPLALQPPGAADPAFAPVERGLALRGPAVAQLRSRVFVAAVAGAVVGNLAFRRLPGKPPVWIACGVLFGVLAAAAGMGAALLASGRRLGRLVAAALGLGLVGWSAADWLLHMTTSPATLLGRLAVAPIGRTPAVEIVVGGGVAAALLAVGLASVGGTSLEHSLRRAGLVAQLRFAVTVQDLRTVILLRRQLAAELPRSKPWLALRPAAVGATGSVVWRRGWRSFLRWPAVRVARVGVLGLVAGAALVGAWRGTTPLVVVAGFALLLVALDAIEPLAQEIDHPTRRSLLPLRSRALLRPHPGRSGRRTGARRARGRGGRLRGYAGCARARGRRRDGAAGGPRCAGRRGGERDHRPVPVGPQPSGAERARRRSFLLAILGVLPVLAARYADRHHLSPAGAAIQTGVLVLLVCSGVLFALTGWLAPKDSRDRRAAVLPRAGLERHYGDLTALAGVDLTVHAGEMVALVGPNGAGKSTFLGLAAGLLTPSSGSVKVSEAPAGSLEARAATSFLPDTPSLYDDLSLDEHLEYVGRLHGAEDWQERGARLLDRLGLADRAGDLPAKFSRGMRQKSSIALAFVRGFSLLLADEPFDGLDPGSREAFGAADRRGGARRAAVIVSTHRADVLERAHRCVALYDGSVSYDGLPGTAELKVLA